MSFWNKLFGKKVDNSNPVGGMEDFMLLIRVYYQAVIAAQMGINNLGSLPDLRIFKQSYHVPTLNNKLGLGEKKQCKKILQEIYHLSDNFFAEIDGSVKKKCRKPQDVQSYLLVFQNFSQELMMLMGNLMQWKFRLPGFFRDAIRKMVDKQVHEVMTRTDWKDEGVRKACVALRKYQGMLGYTEEWMSEYVHSIVMLAKKEPRKNMEE